MIVLFYMDVVLCLLEHAVFIDVPDLHTVGSGRAGIEQIHDFTFPPGPEHLWVEILRNGEIDSYLRAPLGCRTGAPFCQVSGLFPMAL